MDNLKKRTKQVLEYIIDCIEKTGVSPSIREIGDAVGLTSSSAVFAQIDKLVKLGYIEKISNQSRSIVVKGWDGGRTRNIPVIITVKNIDDIFSIDNVSGYISHSIKSSIDNEYFALVINDENLNQYGVLKGDIVIVEKTKDIKSDDLFVIYKNDGSFGIYKNSECSVDSIKSKKDEKLDLIGRIIGLQREYK